MKSEVELLIHEVLDGNASEDDIEKLGEQLLNDAEARRLYYDLLTIDQMLADNYGVPSHLAAHMNGTRDSWSAKKLFGRNVRLSLIGAAAVLVGVLSVMLVIRAGQSKVMIASSLDSQFLIDGRSKEDATWKAGQRLTVESGVVKAGIHPSVEVVIAGPASVTLLDRDGSVSVDEGSAFFDFSSGAPDMKILAAGASLRHIGTQFGITAENAKKAELHVSSGSVQIEFPEGGSKKTVGAGGALKWGTEDSLTTTNLDINKFQQDLPREVIIFDDDFSEPAGTRLTGKRPDVGMPWLVFDELNTTTAGGGRLDTSSGYRTLGANFRRYQGSQNFSNLVISVSTLVPIQLGDKSNKSGGEVAITLFQDGGKAVFSLAAGAADGYHWRLRNDQDGRVSPITEVSALSAAELTLRYDANNGNVSLHNGSSARSPMIARISVNATITPLVSLTIQNKSTGDIALRRLMATAINYRN